MFAFRWLQVAAYDFIVPVVINQTGAPTPAATPFPPTPAPTNKNSGSSVHHIIQPRPVHVEIVTPRRKVEATALRQPLQLSHQHLEFTLSPAMHELAASAGYGHSKVCVVTDGLIPPTESDSDSDSFPNGYIVLCTSFSTSSDLDSDPFPIVFV